MIGLAAALALIIDGKIAGCSGIVGPFLRSFIVGGLKTKLWQFLFIIGMIVGGLFNLGWNAEMAFPPAYPVSWGRYVLGGILVGAGTSLGGGCTSGHGVCGLARLSLRSWIGVPTFMLLAAVIVAICRHALDLGETTTSSVVPLYSPKGWKFMLGAFLVSLVLILLTVLIKRARFVLCPLSSGAIFGLGLGVSGMTDQGKVLNFLDVGGTWDPSLAFVMGCALMVTFPSFVWSLRESSCPLADGAEFEKPVKTSVDLLLLLGTALFGIGWGLCGICPGPALAGAIPYASQGSGPGLSYGLFFLVFCAAWLATDRLHAAYNARAAATEVAATEVKASEKVFAMEQCNLLAEMQSGETNEA